MVASVVVVASVVAAGSSEGTPAGAGTVAGTASVVAESAVAGSDVAESVVAESAADTPPSVVVAAGTPPSVAVAAVPDAGTPWSLAAARPASEGRHAQLPLVLGPLAVPSLAAADRSSGAAPLAPWPPMHPPPCPPPCPPSCSQPCHRLCTPSSSADTDCLKNGRRLLLRNEKNVSLGTHVVHIAGYVNIACYVVS